MNENIEHLLNKWFIGEASKEEILELQNHTDLEQLAKTLDMQSKFDLDTVHADEMWERFESKNTVTPTKTINKSANNRAIVLAIVVGLITGLLTVILIDRNKTIRTSVGETKEYIFADGSKAIISPSSTLKFNARKWGNNRKIKLKGQAYFQVEKGSPFSVITKNGNVEVLGTQFDVWSGMASGYRVQCYEGRVRTYKNGIFDEELTKNQSLTQNNKEEWSVDSIDILEPDWFENTRYFKAISAKSLVAELGRWFEVSLVLDESLEEERFVGTLRLDDLNKTLEYIAETMDWVYDRSQNQVVFKKK